MGDMLGIRLPDHILNKLRNLADQKNLSANQLGKKAIIEWVEVLFTSRNLRMVIFPKEILVKMLGYLTPEQRNAIASDVATSVSEYFSFLSTTHRDRLTHSEIQLVISKFLGDTGLLWFDHLHFAKHPDLGEGAASYAFEGTHHSGLRWSEFAMIVLDQVVSSFFQGTIDQESRYLDEHSLKFSFHCPTQAV